MEQIAGQHASAQLASQPTSQLAQHQPPSLLGQVRLYVLRGVAFTPMDAGWMGRPGKSDPYLYCELGKQKFNDRENYVEVRRGCWHGRRTA